MILPIYVEPQPILHQKTEPIAEVTDEVRQLAASMRETMHGAKGIGLAAPQIGKLIALCILEIVDEEDPEESTPFIALINPKITWTGGRKVPMMEACLSIPGLEGIVYRPEKIKVTALDLDGDEIELQAEGLVARVIQHEIDHLNGILFTEYVDKKQLKQRPVTKYPTLSA